MKMGSFHFFVLLLVVVVVETEIVTETTMGNLVGVMETLKRRQPWQLLDYWDQCWPQIQTVVQVNLQLVLIKMPLETLE
jgi:formate/nitrite transporter FocA (FNT family)